jgi:ABC-type transport system involved in cytochrome bd biosynthesis fused ATPase/permease subunit
MRLRTLASLSLVLFLAIYLAQRQPAVVLFLTLLFIVVAPISSRAMPELRRIWNKYWPRLNE